MSNHQSILEFVRGIKPWQVLKQLGIWRNGNTWSFPLCEDPIIITMNDLIMGFKNNLHDKQALQEWATYILVDSSYINFDDTLEKDPRFDDIVTALWDASFGEEVDWKNLKDLIDI